MALDIEKIHILLGNTGHDTTIHYFDSIGSTNHWLLEQAGNTAMHQHICLADYQNAGRGREGKAWQDTPGRNIAMSMAWAFDQPAASLSPLGLVTGIAVVEALESMGVMGLKLKWPNDVYLNGAKLAGILIQTRSVNGTSCCAVSGVGLNIFLGPDERESIDQPVALLSEAGINVNERENVIGAIILQLRHAYQTFADKGWAYFETRWRELDYFQGHTVCLVQGDSRIYGQYMGINSHGALCLELPEGQVREYYAGEVSVRAAMP